MSARRTVRRWAGWLLLSAAVHVLLLWLLPSSRPVPSASPRRSAQLELAWIDAVPPPPRRPSPPPPPPRAKAGPTHSAHQASAASAQQEAPAAALPLSLGGGDLPVAQAPSLTPGTGTALRLLRGLPEEAARGSTVRNDETEVVDEAAVREYQGEVVARRLNQELAVDLAAAAVRTGRVPGHFRQLEDALRKGAGAGGVRHSERPAGDVARDVAETMFGPSSDADAKALSDSPMGRSVQQQTLPLPNVEDQRFREAALAMMTASEGQFRRAQRPRLRTVLELTQDPTGALADVSVLERSGDQAFDESVIHLSRRVVRELPESDEKGLGGRFWRSRWVFTWEPPQVRVRLLDVRPVLQ